MAYVLGWVANHAAHGVPLSGRRNEMTNDMVEAILEQGRLQERQRIVDRLRYGVKEFRRMAEDYPKWELVAEILEEEADVIETGDY
jgi:hypothetical protein